MKPYKKRRASNDDRKNVAYKYEVNSNDKTVNEFIAMGFERNDVLQCIHDVNLRLSWSINSMCLIYSRQKRSWCKGIVFAITVDENTQEWLTVKYNNGNRKNMQRFNNNIKPIGLSYESNETIIQNIYNKLKSKELTSHTLNQTIKMQSEQYRDTDSFNDEKEHKQNIYKMTWKQIANCVNHEMFSALANTLRSIIDTKDEFKVYDHDLETDQIETMVEVLKTKRKLAVEESEYICKLCQRAVQFVPITAHNRKRQNNEDDKEHVETDDNKEPFESDDIKEQLESDNIKEQFESDDDQDQLESDDVKEQFESDDDKVMNIAKHNGLNSVLLQDIFDVHRHFRFSHYHFDEYTKDQYDSDLSNVDDKYVDLQSFMKTITVKDSFTFYPSYIIYDDMFEIFDYVFVVSQYLHYTRNSLKYRTNGPYALKLVIIPKSVRSVYDEDIIFSYDIEYIDDYLRNKNVFEYIDGYLRKHNKTHKHKKRNKNHWTPKQQTNHKQKRQGKEI